MEDSPRPEMQRDVQRLLGRCFLRLQQYEKLLKALVADHTLAGPAHELEAIREQRRNTVAKMTLGQLAAEFLGSYVVVAGQPEGRDVLENADTTVISMSFKFSLEVSPEKSEELRRAIADLVALRNKLAHNFIDLYDVWTDDGCIAASAFLVQSYDRIDVHYEELRGWAKSMLEASEYSAAFMQSKEFLDHIFDGIAPDGVVDWPHAGCVRALRDALKHLSLAGGWAKLSDAVTWLDAHHADQVPARYGCRSWPHVLHESRQFDLEYRLEAVGGEARIAWFRERQARSEKRLAR